MPVRTLLPRLYFILTSLLLGCTSVVQIETTKPPLIIVPPEQWKVVVVNTFDASQLPDTAGGKAEILHLGT
ncbi:hypothetical protein [Pontibacter ruber]|uniref:Uncharacterized protein n=1 Tax=Pontibacter ruber TaxID=1343895 RepID=A0ABW5CVM0_9BACT|nr:hypothetical protein [Pontibacter ruber]